MNLDDTANIAEIVSMIVVVGSVIFGLKQLQHFRLQRKTQAAMELGRYFHNPKFVVSLRILMSLSEEEYKNNLKHKGTEYEDAAMLVSLTFESIAIMVHRRMLRIEDVWELMGGVLSDVWLRLYPWVKDKRELQQSEKFNEWAQWLVNQFKSFAVEEHCIPAHKKYSNWKPY
ncbi:MAG: hypothetical protein OQJ89_00280 [Kangiellaceae bacterium]|nr:hypothetical protein [Kangiellaceae bacterium]MCW8999835.1 hypothetical protein [Kangiellaceae bacterium]MCW9015375.1 hypothetical protein [Kangiellaceae bacterium]